MKVSIFTIFVLITLIYTHTLHAGIRCKNDIISVGETSTEVLMKLSKCGEVISKEVVGKETTVTPNKESNEKTKKEKSIELWHIRVKELGGTTYCYPLTFEEGRLQHIGSWSKCD